MDNSRISEPYDISSKNNPSCNHNGGQNNNSEYVVQILENHQEIYSKCMFNQTEPMLIAVYRDKLPFG